MNIRQSNKFKKDLKRCKNQGSDIDLLKSIVRTLAVPDKLPEKNHDHELQGDYNQYRECHITPDWLLIYRYSENELELVRTGSHSELFRK